jgi:predicted dehydrogenase
MALRDCASVAGPYDTVVCPIFGDRMAARLDGEIELVAGALSSDPEKAKRSGEDLLLEPERVYRNYQAMVEAEVKLPVGERIDFVSIVTPNHLHFPVAKLFLEAGFNVVCDKPMTFDLGEALALRELVKKSGKIFALTHNYTGYPMVKQALLLLCTTNRIGLSITFLRRCTS